MQSKEKVRMCPFCEGNISISATECNYCGSSLIKTPRKAAYPTDDLASLYDPPYAPNKKSKHVGITPPPIQEREEEQFEEEKKVVKKRKSSVEDEEASNLGSILLLSLGGVLFTLAWLLFFFSDQGVVVLEWKSKFWFAYLLLSIPLLYKGYLKLK